MKIGQKQRNLSEEEVKRIINGLLDLSVLEGEKRILAKGAVSSIASTAGVTTRQVQRIWKKAQDNALATGIYSATPQKKAKCGRKPLYEDEAIVEAVKTVPMNKRGTIRALAKELGVCAWTIHNKKKNGIIISHMNSIRPHLRDDNMFARYLYALNRVRIRAGRHFFHGGYDEVHIDEKWFEITQITKRYYLAPGE